MKINFQEGHVEEVVSNREFGQRYGPYDFNNKPPTMDTSSVYTASSDATTTTYARPIIINNIPKPAKIAIIIGTLDGTGGKKDG